jgi:hypothetical protein
MPYNSFAFSNNVSIPEIANNSSFYSLGSEVYKFKNKKVVSIVGNKEAEEFVENKENLYTYEIGFIPAGYEHRPDLISSVYYGTAIHWWMILLFNNITDPFEGLNVGDRILIPILSSR